MYELPRRHKKSHSSRRSVVTVLARPVFWGLDLCMLSRVFGVAYTFFRPIKGRFEDLLQTFVLWVIFFDVCLGAMYSNSDVTEDNDSLIVNILFVILNSSVLLVALGKSHDYSTATF